MRSFADPKGSLPNHDVVWDGQVSHVYTVDVSAHAQGCHTSHNMYFLFEIPLRKWSPWYSKGNKTHTSQKVAGYHSWKQHLDLPRATNLLQHGKTWIALQWQPILITAAVTARFFRRFLPLEKRQEAIFIKFFDQLGDNVLPWLRDGGILEHAYMTYSKYLFKE